MREAKARPMAGAEGQAEGQGRCQAEGQGRCRPGPSTTPITTPNRLNPALVKIS